MAAKDGAGGASGLWRPVLGVKGLTNRRHTSAPLSPSVGFAVLRVPPDGFRVRRGWVATVGASATLGRHI